MIPSLFNWRTGLALIAILIISGTIFYSRFLARKIAGEERFKAEIWVEAGKLLVNDTTGISNTLVFSIIGENTAIPIIQTNESGEIIDYVNLDSAKVARDRNYVAKKLADFRANPPIEWINPTDSTKRNLYYYGHSTLLTQVQYYPIVQLFIVGLFIAITLIALTSSYASAQNQVWAGMAKETAHQLGTPISSLQGWVEMLKQAENPPELLGEMEKDVNRLNLVSDRFGKIRSIPQLEAHDVTGQVQSMVDYMRKRASGKVRFSVNLPPEPVIANISPPLFDWVIENLLKNALDAIEGNGEIGVLLGTHKNQVFIDVSDTGRGIPRRNQHRVFNPGFTTKKRGWGLGLSLSKRIINQYHRGQLFVKHSEPGNTVFRVVLNKQ